jgi:hypothetical protein
MVPAGRQEQSGGDERMLTGKSQTICGDGLSGSRARYR